MNDEMIKMLKEVFGEDNVQCIEVSSNKIPKAPRNPEGYNSIISPEVYEAIVQVTLAVDNLVDTVEKHKDDKLEDVSGYAMIQYLYFNDILGQALESVGSLYNIHHISKDLMDERAKAHNTTVDKMAKDLSFKKLTEALCKLFS